MYNIKKFKLTGVVDRSRANMGWSYEGNYEVSNSLSKRSFWVHQIAKFLSHSLGRKFPTHSSVVFSVQELYNRRKLFLGLYRFDSSSRGPKGQLQHMFVE
jgi:hypothetical protein